jgi:hypothetical protein
MPSTPSLHCEDLPNANTSTPTCCNNDGKMCGMVRARTIAEPAARA